MVLPALGRSMRELGLDTLWRVAPREHRQEPRAFRRRQVVMVMTVVVGALVLGWSLRIEPGSALFYPAALLLAAVWTVGAFASGPLHLGRTTSTRRPIVGPVLVGLVLAAVFCLGALIVRDIPLLADQAQEVLSHAEEGSPLLLLVVTTANGIAEELCFRGAGYAAVPRWQLPVTTVGYSLVTAATGNVMLTFAALVLGVVVGLERRATGGILAPVLTHLTWSLTMLYALPVIIG